MSRHGRFAPPQSTRNSTALPSFRAASTSAFGAANLRDLPQARHVGGAGHRHRAALHLDEDQLEQVRPDCSALPPLWLADPSRVAPLTSGSRRAGGRGGSPAGRRCRATRRPLGRRTRRAASASLPSDATCTAQRDIVVALRAVSIACAVRGSTGVGIVRPISAAARGSRKHPAPSPRSRARTPRSRAQRRAAHPTLSGATDRGPCRRSWSHRSCTRPPVLR